MLKFDSVEELQSKLLTKDYIADQTLATATFLSLKLGKPLLLEGEVGVGKTELAKVLADLLDTQLIRLQCYEGIDAHQAIYEWNHAKQLMFIRDTTTRSSAERFEDLYSEDFLQKRPLLSAVESDKQVVLLIDEVDRADDEFEAFLLEFLSDFQVTIPEMGTIVAKNRPIVILTSNRTRDLHDALKRRCLYSWIGFPSPALEMEVVTRRIPGASQTLVAKVVGAVQKMRDLDMAKAPGVAETIDWVESLDALGESELTTQASLNTLGAIVKDRDDLELITNSIQEILAD